MPVPLGLGSVKSVGLAAPAEANQPQTAQGQPTTRQILEACVQNRAETLPNPFSDVPANHWAFKAVLTMHYCGADRQATPPRLIEKQS
ncbi:MAG: S-layer protein [Phormidesmis sp. CAN_BIN36]|nr:S-layer protein [Phormidesmis sp. CAN_BIN36]